MLKHIKKIYSDLTEFFLVLITGVFAGSIFTLAYIKYDVKTTLSFADIGGMLAGGGTVGLLYVALNTISSWKKSIKLTHQKNSLEKWYTNATELYVFLRYEVEPQYFNTFELRNLDQIFYDIDKAKRDKLENIAFQDQIDPKRWYESEHRLRKLLNKINSISTKTIESEEQLIMQLTTFTCSNSIPKFEYTLSIITSSINGWIDEENHKILISAIKKYNQKKKEFYKEALEELHK